MFIHKIINNNIVSSLDQHHNEVIVMGRGIAYQKAKGDEIAEEQIEKQFFLKNDQVNHRFLELIKDIPVDIIEVSDEVIAYAKEHSDRELNDGIYITLMDHINYAIERYLQGICATNALLWEIKQFYRDEFAIAKDALNIINRKLMVNLSEDEAGFIALHIVNAQLDGEMEEVAKITKFIHEILNIVRYHVKITLDEESLDYYRFVTHLKFFARRLFNGTKEAKDDIVLFEIIIQRYPQAYSCVEMIERHIKKVYQQSLSISEKLYLTMHIARIKN